MDNMYNYVKKVDGGYIFKPVEKTLSGYSVYFKNEESANTFTDAVLDTQKSKGYNVRVQSLKNGEFKVRITPINSSAYFFLPYNNELDFYGKISVFNQLLGQIQKVIEKVEADLLKPRPKTLIQKRITDNGELYNIESLYDTIEEYEAEAKANGENKPYYPAMKAELMADYSKAIAKKQNNLTKMLIKSSSEIVDKKVSTDYTI